MLSQINKQLEVILENIISDRSIIGTSGNYLKVEVLKNGFKKGSLVTVG